MNGRLLAGGAVVALAVVAVVVASGFGPALAGGNSEDLGSFPTATGGSGGDGSAGGSGDGSTSSSAAYTLTVEEIESCGRTCRDVTSTLENRLSTDATDVVVYSRIYAGNGTDGDVVWEGKEPVGDLAAGESYTATRRVELSIWEANTVREHGGWVTIQTAVRSDERTVRFIQRRDVT